MVTRDLDDGALLAICCDVTVAMEHLAREGVVHGDLAARNVLYAKSRDGKGLVCKVADFGLACCGGAAGSTMSYSLVERAHIPIRWSAPEVLKRGQYSSASDVWSTGVLLWEVFSLGDLPYGVAVNNADVISRVTAGSEGAQLGRPRRCPSEVYGLMTQCWIVGRKNRISISDLRESMDRILGNGPALIPQFPSKATATVVAPSENSDPEVVSIEDIVQSMSLAKAAEFM